MAFYTPRTPKLFHRGWDLAYDGVEFSVLFIFLLVSLFPSQALAFVDEVELSHQELIFVRDPSLEGRAIVGIEAFPKSRSVGRILNSDTLLIRESLAEGSAVRVLSTAYSSTVDQTDASPFTTASGRRVGNGTIAANFLPFGTQVRIGDQLYTVWDRMNARYSGKYIVDIWKPSRYEAVQHGARIVEMEVVSLPPIESE